MSVPSRFFASGAVSLLLVVTLAVTVTVAGELSIWPKPTSATSGISTLVINPTSFTMKQTGYSSDTVKNAWDRYLKYMFPVSVDYSTMRFKSDATINCVEIEVLSKNEELKFEIDESYSLSIPSSGCVSIKAKTVYGAMWAMETLYQLVDYDGATYAFRQAPVTIDLDTPRFPWRGLLIDTSRHWLPLSVLKTMIDALSMNKMNVLHWHTIDAISFPMESTKFPLLTKGAWNPKAVYTSAEVKEVVAYGKARGVRVLPEFDIPGHAYAWGIGYPNVTTKCPKFVHNVNNIPLNPAHSFTFDVVNGFIAEMNEVFSDSHIHLGGDELVDDCWLDDTEVVAWMKEKGFTTGGEIEQYFLDNVYPKVNKTVVAWEEVFLASMKVPKDTIIEVWKDSTTLKSVVESGLRGIMAFGWYLDQQACSRGEHYEFVDTWMDMYTNEPTEGISSHTELIIGGEAAMWSEQVDVTSIFPRVWPRASAPAERLWSSKDVTDLDDAKARLIVFRCKMAQRGILATPIAPDWCDLYDF